MGYSQSYSGTFVYDTQMDLETAIAAAAAYLRAESSIGLDNLVKSPPTETSITITANLHAPASLAYTIEAALLRLAQHAVEGCVVCRFEGDDDTAVCAGDEPY